MEHSVHPVDLVRPWRTATFVASAVAAIELVLLVVLGIALLGDRVADDVRGAAKSARAEAVKPPPPKTDGKPRLARTETSVLVLNGNGVTGAASEAADRLRALGYGVGGVGNATRNDHVRSTVMYRPGYRAEAARLARDLRVEVVAPLDGLRLDQLMGAHVVLVVAG